MAKKATGARKTAATPTEPEKAPDQITPLGEEPVKEEAPKAEETTTEPEKAAPKAPPNSSPVAPFYGLWRVINGRILHFLHIPGEPVEWAPGGSIVDVQNDFLAEMIIRQKSKLNRISEVPEGEELVKVTRNDVLSLAACYKTTPVDAALGKKTAPAPLI